jgi:UDP-4-amino-4,6-dideoxy-L-N-acetyl-beta-L-altrosamine transaminase
MTIIPYGKQFIDRDDIKLVSKSLKQNLITTGNFVKKFENKISTLLKVKYALSCSSGTAALHLAYEAIKLKKNDIVIMPAVNFIAAYSMAKKLGAKVILADVDPNTGQMTPETLINSIKKNKIKKIKAIVTMYLGGYPENVYEFYKIKKIFKCYLIEDGCHALGAKYKFGKDNISIGSCKHSDICTFSMHPVKTITSGEGGIVTTNKLSLYKKILLLRSHGVVKKNHWSYEIRNEGYNYRLSDINCALAISQLNKIAKFINFRKKIFNFYNKNLVDNCFINSAKLKNTTYSSFHLFLARINFDKLKVNKDFFINYMLKKKIILQFHYKPIFLFKKIYSQKNNNKDFKGSLKYYSSFVSVPIFYKLNDKQLLYIVKKIKTFIRVYSK